MSVEPTRSSVAASIPDDPECQPWPGVSLCEARDLVDVETRQAREDLRVVAVTEIDQILRSPAAVGEVRPLILVVDDTPRIVAIQALKRIDPTANIIVCSAG